MDSGRTRPGDIEKALTGLQGVRRARLEMSEDNVKVVRVLVIPEKPSSQTVGEVVSTVRGFGVGVDADSVQVLRTAQAEPGVPPRRRLATLTTDRTGDVFKVSVYLELWGDVLSGDGVSRSGREPERRAVAQATIDAAGELLSEGAHLESTDVVSLGGPSIATVTMILGGRRSIGTAPVRIDEHDAMARATLDAINRFIIAGKEERGLSF